MVGNLFYGELYFTAYLVKPEKIFLLQKTQITGILNKEKKMWNPA